MAANADRLRTDLQRKFGDDLDDNLLSECVKICQTHNLSGEDLFYKWEAQRFNQGPGQLAMADLQEVKNRIQRDLIKANAAKRLTRGNLMGRQSKTFGGTPVKGNVNVNGNNARAGLGTPGRMAMAMARPQDGFDMSKMEEKVAPVAGPSRVAFVGPSADEEAQKKRAYRYMYEKVSERSEVLDDRIDHFGELVKAYYGLEDLGDPSAVTEDDVVVVGRITLDAESTSGPVKLNEASLVLESSRMMGSGARVPIRFDPEVRLRKGKLGAGGQGLFPGAIVALKGKNGGGGSFLATEILSLPPLDPPSAGLVKSETSDTQFSMFVASGPFTVDADLQYRPLQSLITKLKAAKPAVALLVGPFIDATHPSIKIGDVDATPADMFKTEFVDRLRDFLDSSPGSLVLLVPSVRDILSDHAVFPQCELSRTFCNDPRIRLLPNPARFTLNGVHVAVSSVDVLFHLRKEEYLKRAPDVEPLTSPVDPEGQAPTDAMANLCRHLLQQRSFYPIFPVPLDLAHEVNLDVTHSDLLYMCPQDEEEDSGTDPSRARCAPDVLIIPSRLKHFSKIVDNTVAINPSLLTKSTYAVVEYAGHTAPGPARDRLKVDITRLEG
ncbi:DNA polymerase alpha, subunit B [Lentinus tigrinus ALCF2SS1-7]|uniref:DNA polymerase alpha subunit B n=1 Tax=Lentinus tigrinus ALCF2SS1-6 TaxID=1328759 RepID=A0A5C2SFP1_9APHY|nr:DNA polymerase alpha, subunit B [Lentinus tigrinus ALCF2SS1-6]RPD77770.1 DNA polymerase alpha, subunit B [Lentinus tigrinus ALCF2SS1-7]